MTFDTHAEPRNRAERRAAARGTGKGRRASAAVLVASGSALASTAMVLSGGSVVGAATTITVDSTGDAAPVAAHCTNVTTGDCTLRDAVAAAVDGDVIQFSLPAASTIALTQGQIKIVGESLTITGPGAADLTIDGTHNDRIFYIDGGSDKTVTITGLTFTHGEDSSHGGAIYDRGAGLNLFDDVFTSNASTNSDGGAVFVEDVQADVAIRRSQFTGNSAAFDGGAIVTRRVYGTVTVADTTISGNTAHGSSGSGGGLYITSSDKHPELANAVVISNVQVTGNTAGDGGGGVMLDDIYGPITISDSTISGNSAHWRGGGLYLEDAYAGVMVTNTQITSNTSDSDGGGVAVYSGHGAFSFTGVTISGNVANGEGGGFWTSYVVDDGSTASTIAIQTSTISGNSATESGGGVAIARSEEHNYADVTILDTTISGNTANSGGGGVFIAYSYGLTSIIQSTISGNVAKGGESSSYDGGAIAFLSAEDTTNLLAIVQSTITANTGRNVGGVYMPAHLVPPKSTAKDTKPAQTADDADPTKSGKQDKGETKAQTRSHPHTRGSTTLPPGIVTATGTILAGNTGEDVGVAGTVKAQSSIFTKIDAGVTFTDLTGNQMNVANLFLGPLQNNGGPTDTHALLPGSPAIDTGQVPPPSYPTNDFDQRGDGYARVVAGVIDVGAFEVQPPPVIQPTFTG